MSTLLNRKLFREVLKMRSQVFAIVIVVACGIAQLATNITAFQALQDAQWTYYREHRFAHIFAGLKRAPESVVQRIRAIPGVKDAESRIVRDLALEVPGLEARATGRAVSIPEDGRPRLNALHLRRGRYPEPGRPDEILVSETFAAANKLQLGMSVGAAINGRWMRLHIVGVALSPEYIYEIKPGDLFPDNEHFGVLWIGYQALAGAFDMEGAFNDLSILLDVHGSEKAVISEVDRILRPYGGTGAYGRANQVSHTFVTDEIRQNRVFGMIMPGIFLGLAAFLVGTVLMRLVNIQRDQIGTLKAFGFGNAAIAGHYLKLALLIVTLGWVAGILVGSWWAQIIGRLYEQFYHFPSLRLSLRNDTIFATFVVVTGTVLVGCLAVLRHVTMLAPAEAMRPEAPVTFRAGLLEYVNAARWIPLNGRMVIRNIGRYPLKATLSTLGIALGAAVLLVGYYFQDALHYMANLQFRMVQREDRTLLFGSPQDSGARMEVLRLPGVLQAEPLRIVPVRIWNAYRERRVALLGLEPSGRLRRIVGQQGREHVLPLSGLVLTKKLAEILDVRLGSEVSVEALEGRRTLTRFPVAGIVDEALGLTAYMNIREVNMFMLEDRVSSGLLLSVDGARQDRLDSALKTRPEVASVSSRSSALKSFEDTLARTSGMFAYIFVLFSTLIVFAAVYNAGRIALSERSRELASLCVLGFSRAEVAIVVIGEQFVLAAIAIPLGLLIGYGISSWISWNYNLEMFRIPLVISTQSYFGTVVSVIVAAALSALVVQRRIARLNLIAAIKARE
jgi:putative ABC transport system permease protein